MASVVFAQSGWSPKLSILKGVQSMILFAEGEERVRGLLLKILSKKFNMYFLLLFNRECRYLIVI